MSRSPSASISATARTGFALTLTAAANTDEFCDYIKQVKLNAQVLASSLMDLGYKLITGGTDEGIDDIPEIKQRIIREVFNNS